MRFRKAAEPGTALFAALMVGAAASWRLQLQPGTIGLLHDWSIFPAASQNVAYAQQLLDGWYRWRLGEPVVYPTEYPVRFAFAVAGAIGLGGDVVSHGFVFLVPATAFFFAWLLARDLTGSPIGALAAGFFYALNPVMLNKLVSGQAAYVVGYCFLPAVLWAYERAVRAKSPWAAAAFGLLLSLAGVQIQLGLVGALLTLLYAFIPRSDSRLLGRLAFWTIGCATAAIVHAPTLVGIMGGAPGFENQEQLSNVGSYLGLNSVGPMDSVRLLGYVSQYAEVAVRRWSILWNGGMVVVLLCVIMGIAVSSMQFRILSISTLVVTFVLVAGTRSPVGAIVAWSFEHVRYMRVIGELYHLMAVPALMYACAIGFFVVFAQRIRAGTTVFAIMVVALLIVCAPMLSGDASGWLRAFPLQAAYGDVLGERMRGGTRILWLPMEQPLSFEGRGAGLDPMAVTTRGSLWDYTLNWPLTAVDEDLHAGGDLEDALRALSVGAVVDRAGMNSELWRYAADGTNARTFLAHRGPIALAIDHHYRNSTAYAVPDPLPLLWRPREVALVPQRLSVSAAAMLAGYAPIGFAQKRPSDLPYAVLYDPEDIPQEAVELASIARSLQTTTVDARLGFAPVDAWWWFRKEYADTPNLALSIDKHGVSLFSHPAYKDAVAIVGWIATPNGGRVSISVGGRSVTFSTAGSGEWASRVVALGSLRKSEPVEVSTIDFMSEVAIRGVTLLEASSYDDVLSSWKRTLSRATTRVPIRQAHEEVFVRSGTGSDLGYLDPAASYRLVHDSRDNVILIQGANTYPLARMERGSPEFGNRAGDARIISDKPVGPWRLVRIVKTRLRFPAPKVDDSSRLAAWGWVNGDWRVNSPASSFASAIGTTLFEFPRPESDVRVYYGKTFAFHVAYAIGSTALIVGLLLAIMRAIWQAVSGKDSQMAKRKETFSEWPSSTG